MYTLYTAKYNSLWRLAYIRVDLELENWGLFSRKCLSAPTCDNSDNLMDLEKQKLDNVEFSYERN